MQPKTNINKSKEPRNHSIAILGSGLMGHGIAYAAAISGFDVLIIDLTEDTGKKGLEKIHRLLEEDLKNNVISKQIFHEIINRITITSNYEKLENKNLIIEAIFEDLEIKIKAITAAEKFMNTNGFIASNTSTIPISVIASKLKKPENFIGLHFFSPVNRMKLVEIIKGVNTNSHTLRIALDFVSEINKTPIIVNDHPGFYTTRVFAKYPYEGMAMLSEGIKATSIENAGKNAGYPVGPLAVSDEVNIGLIDKIRKQILKYDKDNHKGTWDNVIDLMINKFNRKGRSENGGFYEYPKDEKKYIWKDLKRYFPISTKQIPEKDIMDRLIFIQIIEAIHCYEKNIITTVHDANIGSILGWGFPRSTGGVLQFVNNYGVIRFRDRLIELANQYDERFKPPALLNEMVKNKKYFN